MARVEHLGNIPIELIKIVNRFRIDKSEIDVMAASLAEVGQIHPITVDKNMRLLAGERRILGAQALGWTDIRAEMRLDDEVLGEEVEHDENEVRKDFTWDEKCRLTQSIFKIKAKQDPKWSLRKQEEYGAQNLGKTQIGRRIQLAEAMELIPELAECESEDEAWKQYKKLEEIATVGAARAMVPDSVIHAPQWAQDHYMVGDSLDGMETLPNSSFDFAEVDPPYAIELDRRKKRNEGDGHTDDYEEVTDLAFPPFFQAVAAHTYRLLKPNRFAIFWYAMQWHTEILKWLQEAGFAVNPMPAIWYKNQAGQTAQPDIAFGSSYEPFFLARKGQPRMHRQGRSNVFHFAPLAPSKKIHTTEKPLDLMVDILDTMFATGTGANILVPFLGSGVTLRAAYKSGHTGLGFDKSPGHKKRFLEVVATEFDEANE